MLQLMCCIVLIDLGRGQVQGVVQALCHQTEVKGPAVMVCKAEILLHESFRTKQQSGCCARSRDQVG